VSYRPHGRARVSAISPRAFAVCDRCKFTYNHIDLQWQYDWRGNSLQNLRTLVCDRCLDVPQPQLRAKRITIDPIPIMNARVETYSIDETNFVAAEDGASPILTETGAISLTMEGA